MTPNNKRLLFIVVIYILLCTLLVLYTYNIDQDYHLVPSEIHQLWK